MEVTIYMANDKRDAVGNDRFSLTDDPHCGNGSYDDEYGNDKVILDCGEGPASRVLRTVPQELTDAEVEQVKKNLELTDFKNVYITAAGHLIVVDNKGNEYDAGDARGLPGPAPYVGKNGNWWVNDLDTGAQAAGVNPHIGENGNWWVGEADTGVQSQGDTPYVGENGNWWVGGVDLDTPATLLSVGTVLETVRTDLGENWLLCNGAGIREGEYPALREMIPYNTGWVEYTSDNEYEYISPISNTHKWVRVKRKTGTGTADYAWDKAEVFDTETREVLTVDCPLVVAGKTSNLYGITHDGVRYVLAACCLGEKTAGKLTLHYYKSDDLASWEEFYVTTIDENYNASDFAFDGEEYLSICGYVTTDTGSNYTRNVYATPSNLGTTIKMPDGGGGYKEPRFHAVFPGYFYVPSGSYTYLYRAGTGERVAWLTERPQNLVYFNDRYLVTAFDSTSLSSSSNEIVDLQAGSHIDFKISTLLGYSSTTNVYGYGAEYDPNVNEWVFYYRYSSNTYREVRISADADPTDPAQYRVKKIKNAPSSTAFIKQMSYNRANCDGYKFRDPNVKYLPTHDGDTYKYINATGLGGTTSGGTGECNCEIEFTDDGAGNVTMEVIQRDE